jgi:hypothetical protein
MWVGGGVWVEGGRLNQRDTYTVCHKPGTSVEKKNVLLENSGMEFMVVLAVTPLLLTRLFCCCCCCCCCASCAAYQPP